MASQKLNLFFSAASSEQLTKGPFEKLRFEAETVREVRGGPVIAEHRGHAWHVDNRKFMRLECDTQVTVHFEHVDGTRSESYGPYESFSCVDGVAYANRAVFAFFDLSIGDWYGHAGGRHWPLMIVEPAG